MPTSRSPLNGERSANTHLLSVPKMSDSPSVTGQIQFNTMVELDKESG